MFMLLFPVVVTGASRPFASCEAAEKPPQPVETQASFFVDWIRLPKLDACGLLREKMKSAADAPALRIELEALIAAGKATRIDFSMLTVPDGGRAKIESVREDPAITDYDARIGGDGGIELQPGYIQWINLGLTMEVETSISPDHSTVAVNCAVERHETIAMQRFGSGRCECSYPVRRMDSAQFQLSLPANEWRLTGCQDVPAPPAGGFTDAVSPACPDVVLAFAKAGIQSLTPARGAVPSPRECLLVSEWVEVPADRAAGLCAEVSGHAGIRDKLAADLAANRAVLRAMTVLPLRDHQRSKCTGITNPSAPAEFNLDAFRRQTPESSVELNVFNGGWNFEAEGDFLPQEKHWELRISPEVIALEGTEPVTPRGKDALAAGAVRAVTCSGSSVHLIQPGQTVLAAVQDSTPCGVASGDLSQRRVLMHFIRILP